MAARRMQARSGFRFAVDRATAGNFHGGGFARSSTVKAASALQDQT
jgi:hypothetical protein